MDTTKLTASILQGLAGMLSIFLLYWTVSLLQTETLGARPFSVNAFVYINMRIRERLSVLFEGLLCPYTVQGR